MEESNTTPNFELLENLLQKGIRPIGLIQLHEVCVLKAQFSSRFYDCFNVKDISPLKNAILKIYPNIEKRISSDRDIHMTIRYPGYGDIPGLSQEDSGILTCDRRLDSDKLPSVLLYITEIFVSRDGQFASAVVFGIDSPILFDSPMKSNRKPAHLSLWGYPPVRNGELLIGQTIALRDPFIRITETILVDTVKTHFRNFQAVQRDFYKVNDNLEVIERLLVRRVIRIQTFIRYWQSKRYVAWLFRFRSLSKYHRNVLKDFIGRWKTAFMKAKQQRYNDEYGDYLSFVAGYNDYYSKSSKII